MTGEEFVRLCFEEKESILSEYCSPETESTVGAMVGDLVRAGADQETLHKLLDLVLTENWYRMLLALNSLVDNLVGAVAKESNEDLDKIANYFSAVVREKARREGGAWKTYYEARSRLK